MVVVSAMGDTTDELLALAKKVTANPPRRELDMLLSAGERISMALLSMALIEQGTPAISFTGSQSGIITSDDHAQARIIDVRPTRVREELGKGKVVIVAGYQGVSEKREVTTLGRGGSDTTAVAMAAALTAEACEIYSDVDGVFTADPRIVPAAHKLRSSRTKKCRSSPTAAPRCSTPRPSSLRAPRASPSTRAAPSRAVRGRWCASRPRASCASPASRWTPRSSSSAARRSRCCRSTARGRARRGMIRAIVPLENVHGLAALLADLRGAEVEQDLAQVSVVGSGIGASKEPLDRALNALQLEPRGVLVAPLRIAFLVPRAAAKECVRRLHAEFIESDRPAAGGSIRGPLGGERS